MQRNYTLKMVQRLTVYDFLGHKIVLKRTLIKVKSVTKTKVGALWYIAFCDILDVRSYHARGQLVEIRETRR